MTLNDQTIYAADGWWAGQATWMRLLHRLVPQRMRRFDAVVDDFAGRRVVDVGCGAGFMSEALARRGAHVIGVDPSTPALAEARAHAAAGGLRIDYRQGVGESLPLPDASVELAVCADVLEHVDDVDRLLAEIARVLVPGGRLLFDTINRTWLARLVVVALGERALGLLPRGTHDPRRFIRPDELGRALARAGFAVERIVGFGPLPTTAVMYLGSAVRRA